MNNIFHQLRGGISVFMVVLLAACGGKDKNNSGNQQAGGSAAKQPPLPVEAIVVNPQPLSSTIVVPGSLLAYETTEIHPEVSGRVVQLNIVEGTFVSKGALLVKLYDEDLQAQLKKLEVQLQIAQQTEQRQSQLLKIQGISQQDYDLSLLQVHNLQADINVIKVAIGKTEVRAPFSGKIGLRNISPGAFITPSTVITTISEVKQLKMQFTVPEKYGSEVKYGQDIDFTIDGSQKTYQAKVFATESAIEENSRSLTVRAIVRSTDGYLIPGAFTRVKIVLGKTDNALMIPTESVIPQGRKKQVFLFRDGKAFAAEVNTGVRDSATIQVLNGINAGDTLITTGLLFLKPGGDVKITKLKESK